MISPPSHKNTGVLSLFQRLPAIPPPSPRTSYLSSPLLLSHSENSSAIVLFLRVPPSTLSPSHAHLPHPPPPLHRFVADGGRRRRGVKEGVGERSKWEEGREGRKRGRGAGVGDGREGKQTRKVREAKSHRITLRGISLILSLLLS